MVIHNISALNVRFGMTEEGLDLLGVNIMLDSKSELDKIFLSYNKILKRLKKISII